MPTNMGTADRIIRALIGVALLAYAVFGTASGAILIIAVIVGIVMLATSGLSFCPLYRIVGIRTCEDC